MTTVVDQDASTSVAGVKGEDSCLEDEKTFDRTTSKSTHVKNEGNSRANADMSPRRNRSKNVDKYSRRRGRYNKKCTVQEVRAEAAQILEEFLRHQLAQKNIQVESPARRDQPPDHGLQSPDHGLQSPDSGYQRYVELSIRAETTASGDSSESPTASVNPPRLPAVYQAQDSIPYADEVDEYETDLQKADSLPSDYKESFLGGSDLPELEIHHGHSKSDPPCTLYDVTIEKPYRPKEPKVPPPPPPPSTPYTESEGSSEKVVSVPYTLDRSSTMSTDYSKSLPQSSDSLSASTDLSSRKQTSPKKRYTPPDTLDIDPYSHGARGTYSDSYRERSSSSPTKSSILSRLMRMKKSSTSSSSELEVETSDPTLRRKKKKSMFKKAQERLSVMFRMKKSKSSPNVEQFAIDDTRPKFVKKPKHKKQRDKHDKRRSLSKNDVDESDMSPRKTPDAVVEEKHSHMSQRIRQHHIGEDGGRMLRTEDSTEIVDIRNQREKKHIEKEWKVKESSDTKSGGFMGRVKRMTSRDRSKKRVKGSHSAHENLSDARNDETRPKSYSRNISVPSGRHQDRGFAFASGDDGGSHRLLVDNDGGYDYIQTQRQVDGNKEDISATQVVSQSDIRRHSSCIDIVDHTGAMVQRFYFDADDELPRNKSFDIDRETCVHEKRFEEDGHIKTVRDVDTHSHIYLSEDDDIETDGDTGPSENVPFKDLSDSKKEELYEKIAEKLAAIGDSLNTRQEETLAAATSPPPKDPDVMERTQLNALEREISDCLKEVANDVDARLAANARRAAFTIVGQLTYSQFRNAVSSTVDNHEGWIQLAGLFNLTKKAVGLVGAGGALAVQIKEASLQCVEDNFAKWIVGQGGWETMLSDDSDSDSEVD